VMQTIAFLFRMGPLWFGLAFLAPLIATLLTRGGITPPFGLSAIMTGLVLGGGVGAIATYRRSWL
jgi:Sec-independent protein secretion pathway component TatC